MKLLGRLVKAVFVTAVVALPIIVFWKHQDIIDWYRLRNYEPPARIAELAANTEMTDYGRKLFYVHNPALNNRDEFNQNCAGFEQTIILGCYITNQAIYIFDVQDRRLEGIEEVTSAHEMLHAAYDRLSASEKEEVDRMTSTAFDALKDQRIKDVIASYGKRDASVVSNELHSILGTEVRDLPADLESYYARYFNDRAAVVSYSEQYEDVFTAQQNRIQALSDQIEQLENELAAQRATINNLEAEISADAARLNRLRNQNRVEEYNAGVAPYNAKVNHYRQIIADYNAKVKRMNGLIEEHNSLAIEQKALINAIDSHQPSL